MDEKLKKRGRRILFSLAVFFTMLLLDKSGALPAVFENRLLSFLCFLIPYLFCGFSVLRDAVSGIRNRRPFDECFLMTLATIGAFLSGENAEAVAVMLFYQVGEWFQSYALGRTRRSISALMEIAPESANVERPDGSVETVDPEEVSIGDILLIRPGEKVPVDGLVISGESRINTAALTGESVPRSVRSGDPIISGCINGEGSLRIEAVKVFEDSTVSRILSLVEEASEKKSRTENFITRFARVYTPIVVCLALMLAVLPPLFLLLAVRLGLAAPTVFALPPPLSFLYRACTFLVVSCPCALVISVPLAFFGGIGAVSSSGVLVKGSNYLELLAKLKVVVSDKTGTLTEGNFEVSELLPSPGTEERELLFQAALAEGLSTHPIAKSIREEYRRLFGGQDPSEGGISETENLSGLGIRSRVNGRVILLGNEKLMESCGISYQRAEDRAATISYVALDGRCLGAILIRDRLKKGAKEAVAALKKEGVERFVLLTGDKESVGEAVAGELGADKVYAELLPEGKVEKLELLLSEEREKGRKGVLAFIGDGINDAPVLSRADVGIAMGAMGSDAAIEAADVVIMDDDIGRLPEVIRIARRVIRIAVQNIAFALIVKICILLLSALGFANMWAAVFSDVGVAVICILNSMRLLGRRERRKD